jgi:hypothetical protein
VPGEQAGQFVFTSSLATQILKNLLPQLQPHLYPQPPAPAPVPRAAETAIPAPVLPAVVAPPAPPRPPVQEKPDGSSSQVDTLVKEPEPAQGGFPEDLDPGMAAPAPSAPAP